jgi:hypothetical protein
LSRKKAMLIPVSASAKYMTPTPNKHPNRDEKFI